MLGQCFGTRNRKGRYRQFNQIGVEAYGFSGPDIDLELILLARDIWEGLGLTKVLAKNK